MNPKKKEDSDRGMKVISDALFGDLFAKVFCDVFNFPHLRWKILWFRSFRNLIF